MPPPHPSPSHRRALSIGSDSDSDGFEIVGESSSSQPQRSQHAQQQAPRARARPSAVAPNTEEGSSQGSSAEVLRSLIPDRAQLERERLERLRQRQIEQGGPAGVHAAAGGAGPVTEQQWERNARRALDGRAPAALLDRSSAAQAIVAEKNAHEVIRSALSNAGLVLNNVGSALGGLAGGLEGLRAAGPSQRAAQPAGGPARSGANGLSNPLYWWENPSLDSGGASSAPNAAASSSAKPTAGSTSGPRSAGDTFQGSQAAPQSARASAQPSASGSGNPSTSSHQWKSSQSGNGGASSSSASSAQAQAGTPEVKVENASNGALAINTAAMAPCPRPRKRSTSPLFQPDSVKRPKVMPSSDTPAASATQISSSKRKSGPGSTYDPYAPVQPSDRFWNGTIKHSYNRYAHPDQPGVQLASLIQPRGKVAASPSSRTLAGASTAGSKETRLEEIVASTYCHHLDWIKEDLIPTGKTWEQGGSCPKVTFFTHSNKPEEKGVLPELQDYPNWTVIVPIHPSAASASNGNKGGSGSGFSGQRQQWYGVMHCKFFLLFYPDSHMRFILLSGNLCSYDWDRIENTVFIQDFPAFSASGMTDRVTRTHKSISTPFGTELLKLLDSLSLPSGHSVRTRLQQYDLTGAIGSLVISAPQRRALTDWRQVNEWGMGRLGDVVRAPFLPAWKDEEDVESGVGLQPARGGVDLEAQGSSLGDLRSRWLQQFHLLASGLDPQGAPMSRAPALPLPSASTKAVQRYGDLLYPSHSIAASYVSPSSKGGVAARFKGAVPPPNQPPHSKRPPPGQAKRTIKGKPSDVTWPPVKVCFPTARWVHEEAIEGPGGAGTFFGKKDKFLEGGPRQAFHQPVSKRGNFMMHAKILLALQPGYDLDDALLVPGASERLKDVSDSGPATKTKLNGGAPGPSGSSGQGTAKGQSVADSITISDSDADDDDSNEDDDKTASEDDEPGVRARASGVASSRKGPSNLAALDKGKGRLIMDVDEETESERDQLADEDGDDAAAETPEAIGWVYTGSHNFTPSAWGTLTDKKETPSLTMSNWEVGIVLPLFDARDGRKKIGTKGGFDIYRHVSTLAYNTVSYRRPLKQYGPKDVPWDQFAPENQAAMNQSPG